MKNLALKAGRFLYRNLGWSANQRHKSVFKDKIRDAESGNRMIRDIIANGQPAMVSRFGSPESRCLLNFLEIEESNAPTALGNLNAQLKGSASAWKSDVKVDLQDLVGFFPPTDQMLARFSSFYITQLRKMDAIGIWGFVPGETFLMKKYCSMAIPYDPKALEPYYFDDPWSKALAGKRVLVIHPFAASIQKQYQLHTKLFNNVSVLPAFHLITIAAVQSIAANKTGFNNWFDALEWMQQQIDKIDFDVAIIGAGSYGVPLSAYIKDKGRIAIHIGGATQVLFGIKGKRWDDHPVSDFYNEYWMRPALSELVPNADKVEGGCYW